jgi:hypothetical protein
MIGTEDSIYTYEYEQHYKILPAINNWHASKERIKNGTPVGEGFSYTSDNNPDWMTSHQLESWISTNAHLIGKI